MNYLSIFVICIDVYKIYSLTSQSTFLYFSLNTNNNPSIVRISIHFITWRILFWLGFYLYYLNYSTLICIHIIIYIKSLFYFSIERRDILDFFYYVILNWYYFYLFFIILPYTSCSLSIHNFTFFDFCLQCIQYTDTYYLLIILIIVYYYYYTQPTVACR